MSATDRTNPPDPRLEAWRPDLADVALVGRVASQRFVEPRPMQVRAARAHVYRHPSSDGPLETEALHGEVVHVLELAHGWAWCQMARDRHVGWLSAAALRREIVSPTHRIAALATPVLARADVKSPLWYTLSLGCEVCVAEIEGRFARLETGGWVTRPHLAPLDSPEPDPVAVAERFLGVPYVWGGRTSAGVDCSGLVQLALMAAGAACPRDSDMQEAMLGVPLDIDVAGIGRSRDSAVALQRGDLVFWPGHVGMLTASDTLLHANAHHMSVTREPLAEAIARTAAAGGEVRSVVRPAVTEA